ncbi:MAG: Pr6Pr family membrane protein [Leptolyngbya sp. BL-A-14]
MLSIRLPFRVLSAIVGWSALALQLYLLIVINMEKGLPAIVGVMKFFDYFTILSNILVATVFAIVGSQRYADGFFAHPKVKTGVGVYIFITGIVYFLILRHTWNPTGLSWLADVILHYVMPGLYLIEWLFFTPKSYLRWNDALRWLVFPLGFAAWALFWGAIFGFYPYPFIDVTKLGYPQVLLNSVLMAIGFLTVGLLLVVIDRVLGRNAQITALRDPSSVRSLR